MAEQIRLAIHFPAYGNQIAAEHAQMWMQVGKTLADSRERFKLVSFGYVDVNPVDRARNLCLATAMLHQADWLVMIDADTWIDGSPDEDAGVMLLRMVSDADRLGATLVSAPVIKRMKGNDLLLEKPNLAVYTVEEGQAVDADGKPSGDVHVIHKSEFYVSLPRRLVEADAVGAACCALNLHKVQAANLHYKFTPQMSEDLDFCAQIRAWRAAQYDAIDKAADEKLRGTSIYVDARVHTGHMSRAFPLLTREL